MWEYFVISVIEENNKQFEFKIIKCIYENRAIFETCCVILNDFFLMFPPWTEYIMADSWFDHDDVMYAMFWNYV